MIQGKWNVRDDTGNVRQSRGAEIDSLPLNAFDKKKLRDQAAAAAAPAQDNSAAARQARHDARHEAWTSPQRVAVTASGGTRHSEETLRLKAAADAERQRAKQPTPAVLVNHGLTLKENLPEIMTLLAEFEQRGRFYPSDFNSENFWNCLVTSVSQGKAQFTLESMERVAQWLAENGYFESETRKRGEPAAKVYPPYQAPAPAPAPNPHPHFRSPVTIVPEDAEAVRRAKSKPLEELKKQVRKGYNYNRPE